MKFVYVIEGEHGLIKIGISRNPEARLANLRTASPFKLKIVFQIQTPYAFEIEQEAHRLLDRHRAGGEWFSVPKEAGVSAIFGAASRLSVSFGGETRPDTDQRPAKIAVAAMILAGVAIWAWPQSGPTNAALASENAPMVIYNDHICGPHLDGACSSDEIAAQRKSIEKAWAEATASRKTACRDETYVELLFLCLER